MNDEEVRPRGVIRKLVDQEDVLATRAQDDIVVRPCDPELQFGVLGPNLPPSQHLNKKFGCCSTGLRALRHQVRGRSCDSL